MKILVECEFDDQSRSVHPCDCHVRPRESVGYLLMQAVHGDAMPLDVGVYLCRETTEIVRDAARRAGAVRA